ncbi:uncharacterized protein [Coffea arabica]|uniref:Retrotransposon Copia-like N-terminal domain-containing protein n=1 Tax=Coffea arabica TaxID=13443 RepID=A0ABM4U5K0_COFAR
MEGDGKKIVSPYTLYANDNPGNIITQVQLKEDNYDEWARAIRTALRAKKKFGFIDGTIAQSDEDSDELEDWWTVNSMLISWMMNTIEPTVRSTLTHREIAKDLWEDIKECLSVTDGARVQQLKTELANCKHQGLSLMSYYAKLKRLWEELANYDAISTCKTVRSNILSTTPLPSVSKAYSLMCQEERVRNISKETEINNEAANFMVQAKTGIKDRSAICKHCNREGHDAEGCFQLIGYLDWWGDRPKMSGSD